MRSVAVVAIAAGLAHASISQPAPGSSPSNWWLVESRTESDAGREFRKLWGARVNEIAGGQRMSMGKSPGLYSIARSKITDDVAEEFYEQLKSQHGGDYEAAKSQAIQNCSLRFSLYNVPDDPFFTKQDLGDYWAKYRDSRWLERDWWNPIDRKMDTASSTLFRRLWLQRVNQEVTGVPAPYQYDPDTVLLYDLANSNMTSHQGRQLYNELKSLTGPAAPRLVMKMVEKLGLQNFVFRRDALSDKPPANPAPVRRPSIKEELRLKAQEDRRSEADRLAHWKRRWQRAFRSAVAATSSQPDARLVHICLKGVPMLSVSSARYLLPANSTGLHVYQTLIVQFGIRDHPFTLVQRRTDGTGTETVYPSTPLTGDAFMEVLPFHFDDRTTEHHLDTLDKVIVEAQGY